VTHHVRDKLLLCERFPDPVAAKKKRVSHLKLHRRLSRHLLQGINKVVRHREPLPE
jgi:hypothetical protein